ncbi:FusB/FusC family EF-G-binding protein [Halobacillus salinus]|uniref:FusB/FusC family EF-G-binding protein n=1 Tax=Halobacillus salinus TaxID=192814 RepID=UPI0009A7E427|nr:FusB/FusC family EF-G-binding protein [Halobacillus salinus]
MEPFIRAEQFHYIENQTATLVNSRSSTNDQAVRSAMIAITQEKVIDAFHTLTEDQKQMISQIDQIKDEGDALFFLSRLKQYIIPFTKLTEQQIKNMFPKVKKLQVPELQAIPWHTLTYLGWTDHGSKRKYIITYLDQEWTALQGEFTPSHHPGICSICHETEEVGLFTVSKHDKSTGETITRGNYICQDSERCNYNLKDKTSFLQFINRIRT